MGAAQRPHSVQQPHRGQRPGKAHRPRRVPRPRGVHSGHIVVGELACLVVLSAVVVGSPSAWAVALPMAAILVSLAVGRYRGRWFYQWLGTGLGYASRPRRLPVAHPYTLLDLIDPLAEPADAARPTTDPDDPAADPGSIQIAIVDGEGALAVLELGEASTAVNDAALCLPALGDLLPEGRAITAQLLIVTRSALGAGPIGEAYRQLTEGHVVGYRRVLLAVRAAATPDGDPGEALGAALRRVRRRLTSERIAYRGLDPAACLSALAEAAGLDPAGLAGMHHSANARAGRSAAPSDRAGFQEEWSTLRLGGMRQSTLRVCRPGTAAGQVGGPLLGRLLSLPGALIAVSLAARGHDVSLTVRVAAHSSARCAAALVAVRRLVASAGLTAQPLSGRQLAGLAATLPLALPVDTDLGNSAGYQVDLAPVGLLAGHNRHGKPVSVRMFAERPTRAILLGGLDLARVFILRALAVNARVMVHSTRPAAWAPFLDAAGLPPELLRLMPPPTDPAHPPRGTPARPTLLVFDNVAPVGRLAPWSSTLLLRETLAATEAPMLARADLVITQRLADQAASLVGAALGLGSGTDWLTRIDGDLIGLFSPPTVRWAALGATDVERWLARPPQGVAAG